MSRTHLFDTTALIALERGTALDSIDDLEWVVSAMTLAEFNVGLLRSPSAGLHQRRLRIFEEACSRPVLEFDQTTARTYAELRVWAGSHGVRPSVPDAVIAATAATNDLVLVTFDQGFKLIEEFEGLDVLVLPYPVR